MSKLGELVVFFLGGFGLLSLLALFLGIVFALIANWRKPPESEPSKGLVIERELTIRLPDHRVLVVREPPARQRKAQLN